MPDKTGSMPPLDWTNVTIGVLTALPEEYSV